MRLAQRLLIIGCIFAGIAGLYMAFAMYIDDVEHPQYATVVSDGQFEVRSYAPMTVAEIAVSGQRREAANRAFTPLADYIFAQNRDGEKIAMTAPVTQTSRPNGGEWTVRFVMPSKYSVATLPKPENAEIALREAGQSKRAVIRFSGVADDQLVAAKERELLAWIAERGLQAKGRPTYAYYNSPFTPGFLRRNEIMFDLQLN